MNITVYSLPACVQCDSTKRLLNRAGVAFEEIDLSKSPESMERIKSLGYSQAPVVEADGQHWSGFRLERLNQIVSQAKAETK